MVRGEGHAGLLHVVDLLLRDGAHRVDEIAASAELEGTNFDRETVGAPPRLDAFPGRPELPNLVDGSPERSLQGEPRTGRGQLASCRRTRAAAARCPAFSSETSPAMPPRN